MKFSIIQVHFIQRVAGQLLASHRDVFVQSDDFQEAVNLANQHLNGSPESVSGDGWICTNVERPFCEEVIAARPVEAKAEAIPPVFEKWPNGVPATVSEKQAFIKGWDSARPAPADALREDHL